MFGELLGSPREATPIGVSRSATSWGTIGVVGEVMPKGLFNTPLVRPYGSGLRTGLRIEEGEDLPCSGHYDVPVELCVSSGAGLAVGTTSWRRPEFSAYIEMIPEDASESLDDNWEDHLDKILRQRIMAFWRSHREVPRASTQQRILARVAQYIAIQCSLGDNIIPKAPEAYMELYMDFLELEVQQYLQQK